MSSADQFVVLKLTYPTTYGANRGRTFSKAEFARESDQALDQMSKFSVPTVTATQTQIKIPFLPRTRL